MEESIKYSDTDQNNLTIRDRAHTSIYEYSRVVEAFNKVLDYKARLRSSLEAQLNSLGKAISVCMENLETLMGNIEVYDQNLDIVANNFNNLNTKEISIKTKYEELLNGSPKESETLEFCPEENIKDHNRAREVLIKRRHNYIDTLGKSFKYLDNELFGIEKLKLELIDAKDQISEKKIEAEKNICVLKESGKRLLEKVENIEVELESSVNEEEELIAKLKSIVEKIEINIEISSEIDHLLSTCLESSVPKNLSENDLISAGK